MPEKIAIQSWTVRRGKRYPSFFENKGDGMIRVSEARGLEMLAERIVPWTDELKTYFSEKEQKKKDGQK